MSRKGSEIPSKSKRLVDEPDDFHVPSFDILSQTQTQKSKEKEKCGSVNSKMKKDKIKEAKERGKKRKGKKIRTSSESNSDLNED